MIEIVDAKEKLDEFIPHLDAMLTEGLITLERVQIIKYRGARRLIAAGHRQYSARFGGRAEPR